MQHLSIDTLEQNHEFIARHIGIDHDAEQSMLQALGVATRQALMDAIVPANIARTVPMDLPTPITEAHALQELRVMANKNRILKSCIGQGYHGTHTPNVILRNILENPAWYTAYTPYQAEISQGRMEALINFQTMVCDLTHLPIAGASMLDEATAAAEAMTLAKRSVKSKSKRFLVHSGCLPQTIEVIGTRATPLGIEAVVVSAPKWQKTLAAGDYFAVLDQYPSNFGHVVDHRSDVAVVHAHQGAYIVAADLLALTLLTPPGSWGADIVVGTTQRFGMPMCNGGPHAAFLACRDSYKRSMPGRLVGVSVDAHGNPAYRLALQTREQHIRREKATSNICTAQVLPAVVASMFAVYHGHEGLVRIAKRVAMYTAILAKGLSMLSFEFAAEQTNTSTNQVSAFDTLCVSTPHFGQSIAITQHAISLGLNLCTHLQNQAMLLVSLDETTTRQDIESLWQAFALGSSKLTFVDVAQSLETTPDTTSHCGLIPQALLRNPETEPFLTHPVFNTHHSETAMLRYIRSLSDKDLALDRSMIPLGSCTMKLNATSEMIPVTWPEFANIHPFCPADQRQGYTDLDKQLCQWLCQATGYAGISLQPNAGSQGEYAGLLVVKAYLAANNQAHRHICLIPASAHGTNPASAQMAGMTVVVTQCDVKGNVDMADLQAKCEQYSQDLACVMITYPSTHGVFESEIKTLCDMVHKHGGRVYVDGANMNALVGTAAPGHFGGDVSHLNLHKTFCIPHGGGGPGVGPVCVVADLVPYLPGHATGNLPLANGGVGAISAAPLGNAAVLPISWMYCRMMGAQGLKNATEIAILSANYISQQLQNHYPTLYTSEQGHVAHECILDLRPLKDKTGITAEDVAKRLIDYGFHAPTLSFPVAGTLMVEPTESENLAELDRFIAAMVGIRQEIKHIEDGIWSATDNPLKNAPHTAHHLLTTNWQHNYSQEQAAYPLPSLMHNKYWAPVGRVDNVHGDRNLFCSCIPVADYKNEQ